MVGFNGSLGEGGKGCGVLVLQCPRASSKKKCLAVGAPVSYSRMGRSRAVLVVEKKEKLETRRRATRSGYLIEEQRPEVEVQGVK